MVEERLPQIGLIEEHSLRLFKIRGPEDGARILGIVSHESSFYKLTRACELSETKIDESCKDGPFPVHILHKGALGEIGSFAEVCTVKVGGSGKCCMLKMRIIAEFNSREVSYSSKRDIAEVSTRVTAELHSRKVRTPHESAAVKVAFLIEDCSCEPHITSELSLVKKDFRQNSFIEVDSLRKTCAGEVSGPLEFSPIETRRLHEYGILENALSREFHGATVPSMVPVVRGREYKLCEVRKAFSGITKRYAQTLVGMPRRPCSDR
jgi:hypothetical protein